MPEMSTSIVAPLGESLLVVPEQGLRSEEVGLVMLRVLSDSNIEEEDFATATGSDLVEFFGQEHGNALGLCDQLEVLPDFILAVAEAWVLLLKLHVRY